MRALIWLLCLVCLPATALADGQLLDFQRLEAEQHADQVEVRFALTAASWEAINRLGIKPVLIAEVLGGDRRSRVGKARIVRPDGRFFVVLPETMRAHSVRFALLDPKVSGFAQAGVGVVTLTRPIIAGTPDPEVQDRLGVAGVAPATTHQPQRTSVQACGNWGDEATSCRQLLSQKPTMGAAVVVACGELGEGARMGCLRAASRSPVDLANAVHACTGRLEETQDRVRCVQLASVAKVDPTKMVRACGRHMETSATRLACVGSAAGAVGDPTGVVEQCTFAMDDTPARLDCISAAGRASVDMAASVAACKQAMPWDTSRRRCIEAAAAAKVDISSAIIACRSGATSPAAVLRCVRYAAQGGNPAIAGAIHGCGRDAQDDSTFNSCVAQIANAP